MFEGIFSPGHLLVVLGIALFVMGPSKLPELGASLGKSIRELRKSMQAVEHEVQAEPSKVSQDSTHSS